MLELQKVLRLSITKFEELLGSSRSPLSLTIQSTCRL